MEPRVLPVPPAMEEAARTISATKVHYACAKQRQSEREVWTSIQKALGITVLFKLLSMLFLKDDSSNPPQEEMEENNFIEPEAPRTPQKPRTRAPKPAPPSLPAPAPTKPPTVDLPKNEVVNTQQMCKLPFKCLFWISFHLNMGGVEDLVSGRES